MASLSASDSAPVGLGEAGAGLWAGVVVGRSLDATQRALLLNMCRILDRLDDLSGAVGDELTVVNEKGDRVANPILTEHRQQFLSFLQAAKALGLEKLQPADRGGRSILDELADRRRDRESKAAHS